MQRRVWESGRRQAWEMVAEASVWFCGTSAGELTYPGLSSFLGKREMVFLAGISSLTSPLAPNIWVFPSVTTVSASQVRVRLKGLDPY